MVEGHMEVADEEVQVALNSIIRAQRRAIMDTEEMAEEMGGLEFPNLSFATNGSEIWIAGTYP
jgi:hypothetical protein